MAWILLNNTVNALYQSGFINGFCKNPALMKGANAAS
jgi:hypothetical protein